jgi:hypothetical protein
MRRPALAAMLLLSACTTPQGMRTNGSAFFTGTTNKPPGEAAGCVALAWGAAKGFRVRSSELNGRVSVVLSGTSVAGDDMVADFASDGTGTMNKRPTAWGKMDDKLRDQLAACL